MFFDDECARILRKWLNVRQRLDVDDNCRALFLNRNAGRLKRQGVYHAITRWAENIGLHKTGSPNIEERFPPHSLRHFFTTILLKNGMPREYVKELRGDARRDAVDIYNHIDKEELRNMYLTCMPLFGV